MLTTLILVMAMTSGATLAQEPQQPPAPTQPPARTRPAQAPRPEPATPRATTPRPPGYVYVTPLPGQEQVTPLSMKMARNVRVAVTSQRVNIHINGVDGDTLEASATSDEGPYPVKAQNSGDEANPKVLLYVPVTMVHRAAREINLYVKLPRYVTIDAVESSTGDIQVSGMEAPVAVNTNNGAITVVRVASLKASTRHGDITAREIKGDAVARSTNGDLTFENIGGAIDAAATNGSLNVQNAAGDLRANMTVGDVTAQCIKGRAEVNTVSGAIELIGVAGDIEAVSTSGEVSFTGRIRNGGRYRLKSISGAIEMHIQPDAPGFTAILTTYNGEIDTAFPLKLESQASGGSTNRRLVGRFGDGSTQLILDSFSGGVQLAKAKADALKVCK